MVPTARNARKLDRWLGSPSTTSIRWGRKRSVRRSRSQDGVREGERGSHHGQLRQTALRVRQPPDTIVPGGVGQGPAHECRRARVAWWAGSRR
jgi:hypothetical protein